MIDESRVLLSCAVFLLAGCGVTQVLDRADDGRAILIRTPQPDEADLNELHAKHGIKTVLNLRGKKPKKSWYVEERAGVKAIGARWVHLEVSGSRAPTEEVQRRFFEVIEDPGNWPVVVHCMGGIHRTGVMSALYRMQYQGWSAERAIAEMEENLFNWTITDREALKEFLRQYRRDPAREIDRSQ